MKISTEISSASTVVGEAKAIEMVAKAGFDAYDLSMFKMGRLSEGTWGYVISHPYNSPTSYNYAKELRKIADDNGIVCNQSHAPFPICFPHIRDLQKKAIEFTAIVGGEYCVIHPDNDSSPEENGEFFSSILPFAKEHGVKIATENMWNWDYEKRVAYPAACSLPDNFNAHLDAVNDEDFVACLDIGHAEMRVLGTSALEMIKALGKRLKVLHIHDNDLVRDKHQIPFSMNIAWDSIVKALKQVGYDGYFTLEADSYLKAFNKDNLEQGVLDLKNSARKLADMFEKA